MHTARIGHTYLACEIAKVYAYNGHIIFPKLRVMGVRFEGKKGESLKVSACRVAAGKKLVELVGVQSVLPSRQFSNFLSLSVRAVCMTLDWMRY